MILKNKVAIITGAKSGIGLATARRFASEGARVIISDIQEARKETEKIKYNGGEAFSYQVDVSKAQEVTALFEEVIKMFGRLDILVNNAGIELAKRIPETSIEEWDHLMDVNLKGIFLCSKAAISIMKRQGVGVIMVLQTFLWVTG